MVKNLGENRWRYYVYYAMWPLNLALAVLPSAGNIYTGIHYTYYILYINICLLS